MLHNTKDKYKNSTDNNNNNSNNNAELSRKLFCKPIHRIGLFVCIAIFLISLAAIVLLLDDNKRWLVIFPLSSIIILLAVYYYTKIIRRYLKDIYYHTYISKENSKILNKLVYYDSLTGLPNRKTILDEVENLISKGNKQRFYLIYFDMDEFKKINEIGGYSVGDEVLRYVSRRWNDLIKEGDLLGHLDGDEFSLLIKRDMDRESLMNYIDKFRKVLDEPVSLFGREYFVSASFGISEYPNDGKDGIELLRSSFIAMNTAKESGKDYIQFYTHEMQEEILERIQLENGLIYSVRNNELYMVYQPMYNCKNGSLRGFEALARWEYPAFGFVSPDQFIPIAEETGIIIDMGKWIINNVLTKFKEFHRKYNVRPIVSINISVVQMIEPSFVQMIKDALDETGFDGKYLELEITESVLISYPEYIVEIIGQLRELGIRIALDDFGTGYASLNYLQMLPINVLKIDKSFIDKINKENAMNQIILHLINLAHQLGIEVVAEGVENEEQLKFLSSNCCDYIQGFLLSKPLEEEYIAKQLLSYK